MYIIVAMLNVIIKHRKKTPSMVIRPNALRAALGKGVRFLELLRHREDEPRAVVVSTHSNYKCATFP